MSVHSHEGAPSKLRLGGPFLLPNHMANSRKFDLNNPAPVADDTDEDDETLAAIDEGMRDAEAGRPYHQKKSDTVCLNSTPTRTLWFVRGRKRFGTAAS